MVHLVHKRLFLDKKQLIRLLKGDTVSVGHTFDYEITIELNDEINEMFKKWSK